MLEVTTIFVKVEVEEEEAPDHGTSQISLLVVLATSLAPRGTKVQLPHYHGTTSFLLATQVPEVF